jgi:3',5'-nucleoside bisphosphate phosphatase
LSLKADLHTHTTKSDGALTPRELVLRAKNSGLRIISITDHDTIDALEDAIELGKHEGVEVIPGMELSAVYNGYEIHILGYFIDYKNARLLEALRYFREERLKRVARIVEKLNKLSIPVTIESVLEIAQGASVGRPHVANALVNGGHTSTYQQAFNKYIGDGRPAYEKKVEVTPEETVSLIAEAGGLSFLAHPGRSVAENTLIHLIKSGLDGIEVIHPSHTPQLIEYYRGIVNEYCLLESGGSDFHGGMRGDDQYFGEIGVPVERVDIMRNRLSPN